MRKFAKASEIKVGVVGYGGAFNMGKSHLDLCVKAGMTPAAVAEIDEARREIAEKDFPGISTFPSLSQMLEKTDVGLVIIITPHNTHARLSLEALRAGRSVVAEKPFAIMTSECDAMIREARRRGLLLSTYHNRHWDGCIIQALKTISSGAIGDVVRIEAHSGGWGKPGDWWRSSREISGGILYDWGVHLLEYSLQILGKARLTEVTGFAKEGFWAPQTPYRKKTNEDEGFLCARFDTGQWLTLSVSSIDSKPKEGMLEVTGTKGTYVMAEPWKLITHRDGVTVTETGRNPATDYSPYYANIAAAMLGGEKLVITPEWARRPIHIIELAMKSAKQGRAIRAKYS